MKAIRRLCFWTASCLVLAFACGDDDDDAEIEVCEPENACSCVEGTERETACTCVGGSTCEIDGNGIEFSCQGNAGCGMTCGGDCLVTCPGTTTCDIEVGADSEIVCPGTATCNVTCRESCAVEIAGAARALLTCLDQDAECNLDGCEPTDCGDGVFACRVDCP